MGPFYLQACDRDYNCATLTGIVTVAGQVVSDNVILRNTAIVTGTVRNRDSAVISNAFVTVENSDVVGRLSFLMKSGIGILAISSSIASYLFSPRENLHGGD